MILPDEDDALSQMTQERNALAAECERLVDEVGRLNALVAECNDGVRYWTRLANAEAQSAADAREALMGMGHALEDAKREGRELLALYESALTTLAKAEREAASARKLMVDALTAVVPAHAGGLT